jgi:hypothetical protein
MEAGLHGTNGEPGMAAVACADRDRIGTTSQKEFLSGGKNHGDSELFGQTRPSPRVGVGTGHHVHAWNPGERGGMAVSHATAANYRNANGIETR